MNRKHPPKFLIDRILPLGEVSLLSGASGSNKTTFISYLLNLWTSGQPVFGFQSNPGPVVYIALDRSLSETEDRLISSGLDLDKIEFHSLDAEPVIGPAILDKYVKPEHKLVIIEAAIRMMAGDKANPNDYLAVSRTLALLKRWVRQAERGILFTSHDSKARDKEGVFTNVRERTAGSVAWGGMSSTVFNMTKTSPVLRTLTVSSRYYAEFERQFMIDDSGRLVESNEYGDNLSLTESEKLFAMLVSLPPGSEISLQQISQATSLERTQIYLTLKGLTESRVLTRISPDGVPALFKRLESAAQQTQ